MSKQDRPPSTLQANEIEKDLPGLTRLRMFRRRLIRHLFDNYNEVDESDACALDFWIDGQNRYFSLSSGSERDLIDLHGVFIHAESLLRRFTVMCGYLPPAELDEFLDRALIVGSCFATSRICFEDQDYLRGRSHPERSRLGGKASARLNDSERKLVAQFMQQQVGQGLSERTAAKLASTRLRTGQLIENKSIELGSGRIRDMWREWLIC